MQVYHLSHIDLDGYGCQMVSLTFFGSAKVHCFNANYGKEVSTRLEQIFNAIKTQDKKEKAYILISDLNLTLQESQNLSQAVLELNLEGYCVCCELLDHHKSGQECANKYAWYVLDTKRCATKIVYETLLARYGLQDSTKAWLEPMVEMINSIDLWLEDAACFEFGKVAMRLIVEAKELNRFMFDSADRAYKLAMLKKSAQFLQQKNGHILLDNAILEMKKCFLQGDLLSDTLDNLASNYQCKLLAQKVESCSVHYKQYKGFLTYSIGNISVLANLFLKQNLEFAFFMDVSARGNVSLRSNDACDVSVIAKEFFNGGGHPNASGGKIVDFKESFDYAEIKAVVEEILESV